MIPTEFLFNLNIEADKHVDTNRLRALKSEKVLRAEPLESFHEADVTPTSNNTLPFRHTSLHYSS
jgi:hypothetical protein